MNKLLVICGPTAVGKTSLGLELAKDFDGEIVSADSRQVYKNMDIGTGKDLPEDSKFRIQNSKLGEKGVGYYDADGVKIWGYDLVSPEEEFSVAQYEKIANKVFNDIWGRDRLPILVGGTGFYIKAAVDGIQTSRIPKNEKLREALKGRGVEELFEKLSELDPVKAASLNQSDRKNPRRLIRAIEIAQWNTEARSGKLTSGSEEPLARRDAGMDNLFVGLKAPKKVLHKRIEERVEKRLKHGLLEEVGSLLANGVGWQDQSMQAIGYKEWKPVITGHTQDSTEDIERFNRAVEKWVNNEKQYAKRQMTWFKKDRRINWFDITKKDYKKNIEKLVDKWYSSSRK